MNTLVRPADRSDLLRINEIYNSCIVGSHTSFDTEPWTPKEREQWYARYVEPSRFHLLVIELDGLVMGFASSSPFRDKAAYDTSVETTIVLDERILGQGFGRTLLEALLTEITDGSAHRAYALIALPNEASVRLHAAVGYRSVGVLDEVGHKLDDYHSVQIMERAL